MATALPNLKNLPYGGAEAVVDSSSNEFVNNAIVDSTKENCLVNKSIHEEFVSAYKTWILSSKLNDIVGFELFSIGAYSNGTTEAFDKFYLKNSTRRFRCFKGEYMYHQAAWRNYFPNWKFLDDEEVRPNDAVVISLPFADLGSEHPQMKKILDECANLNVPVMLDCAYFGLCKDVEFNFNHPAITDITFSLSKFLPVAHLRIGVRFTKVDDDDSLLVTHKTQYMNRIGAAVGLKIFKNYTPDYNYLTYQATQETLCNNLNLTPSKCVIFGIDNVNMYPQYNRGGLSNRLCLSKYLNNKEV
jgi:hypothetical protein